MFFLIDIFWVVGAYLLDRFKLVFFEIYLIDKFWI